VHCIIFFPPKWGAWQENSPLQGVRQGDPLSPMLLLLAIEPLHKLIRKAQNMGILNTLSRTCDMFRMSIYADDATLFLKPTSHDLNVTIEILNIFADASGLATNMSKTECYPIHCANINLHFIGTVNLKISHFPCKYLGLPLHFRKPNRAMFQPVIQKIEGRVPGWKRNFLTHPGRELLVNSVLSSMPTYFLTVFKMPKWALKN
jgi:hypothetical protein